MKIKSTNKFWIFGIIALLIFIYFVPKEIAYPKYKNLSWLMFIIIFGVLPLVIYKIIKTSNTDFSPVKILGICALSILIVGPTCAFFQNYRKAKELKVNGKSTKCIVLDRKASKNDWLINCKYQVKNIEFITYYHTDKENKYRIGDTLKLIYNTEYPRMYEIDF
jgi:hypothetical protein